MKKVLMLALFFVSPAFAGEYDRPGFVTQVEEGRLWVFKANSPAWEQFKKTGEPVQQFTDIGSGPNGMTVKSADQETLGAYLKTIQAEKK